MIAIMTIMVLIAIVKMMVMVPITTIMVMMTILAKVDGKDYNYVNGDN